MFHVLFILFQFNVHFETTNISISLKLEALQHAPSTLEKRKINGIMETNVCGMLTIINEREPSRKFWKEGKSIIYISRICKLESESKTEKGTKSCNIVCYNGQEAHQAATQQF